MAWKARYIKANDDFGQLERKQNIQKKAMYIKTIRFQSGLRIVDEHGVLKKDGGEQKWIIADCGGSMGFIRNDLLLLSSKVEIIMVK